MRERRSGQVRSSCLVNSRRFVVDATRCTQYTDSSFRVSRPFCWATETYVRRSKCSNASRAKAQPTERTPNAVRFHLGFVCECYSNTLPVLSDRPVLAKRGKTASKMDKWRTAICRSRPKAITMDRLGINSPTVNSPTENLPTLATGKPENGKKNSPQ